MLSHCVSFPHSFRVSYNTHIWCCPQQSRQFLFSTWISPIEVISFLALLSSPVRSDIVSKVGGRSSEEDAPRELWKVRLPALFHNKQRSTKKPGVRDAKQIAYAFASSSYFLLKTNLSTSSFSKAKKTTFYTKKDNNKLRACLKQILF